MASKFSNSINLNKSRLVFFLLSCMGILVMVFAIPRVSFPLAFSYLVTLILRPIISPLIKLGLNKFLSYFIVIAAVLFLLIFPLVKFAPVITHELDNVQSYLPKIERFAYNSFYKIKTEMYERFNYEIEFNYVTQIVKWTQENAKVLIFKVPKFLAQTLEWIFLVPLFVFFILKDSKRFTTGILRLVPNPMFERTYYVIHQFNKKLGDYIFAKFVEASIIGLQVFVGLMILDVKFSLLLAIVAALTNVIPYLGPLLGLIPALIICIIEHGMGPTLFGLLLLYVVANIIDLAIIFPILVSKIVDLHPFVVVVSVILGSQYFGVVGMVCSIPMAAIFKLIFIEIYRSIYSSQQKNF